MKWFDILKTRTNIFASDIECFTLSGFLIMFYNYTNYIVLYIFAMNIDMVVKIDM